MKICRQFSGVVAGLLLATPYSSLAQSDAAAPIRVKNSLPIMQGSGLSSPKSALLGSELGWSVELQASVQSHANDAAGSSNGAGSYNSAGANETLVLDGEVQSLSALLQWKFSPLWQASIELIGIKNTDGNFDSAIDRWHDAFGLDDGDRDLFSQDQLRFEYTNSSGRSVLVDRASGLGDTEIGLAYQAISNRRVNLSLNAGLSLSAGEPKDWLASGEADVSFSVALSSARRGSSRHSPIAWHANVGLLHIGDETLLGARTKSFVGFTSLGVHWKPSERWRWSAQLDGHQALFESAIPELNKDAWQMAFGLEFAHRWQVYFAEDLSVNRAADFSFGIRYRVR